ncbi:MAG: 50S ribosomal protein L10 [Myxococcales bacterium]|nr:MAG: 50S ribosomal protein L10 [Myxococcales bacterium]
MATSQATKEAQLNSIRSRFEKASSAVLLDFKGTDVETVTDLRNKFREAGVDYAVVKNTLIEKAIEGTALDALDDFKAQLKGPTALAWAYEDPSAAAKVLKAFKKGLEKDTLNVKGGVMDSSFLSAKRVEGELANLPGKDEIRAQLLATLQAAASDLVRQLNAAGQNFAHVLSARERSLSSGP